MGNEDESCINCMQGFTLQRNGTDYQYLRKSLQTSFSWSLQGSHYTNTCPVMFIADALSTLLPDSDCNFQQVTASERSEMKFICLSCLAMLKQAMVGRAAEKEFLSKRSGENRCIKSSEVKVERETESESIDDAPPVRLAPPPVRLAPPPVRLATPPVRLAPPVLVSSAPIRNPLGHKRRSETKNESIDDAPPVRLAPPALLSSAPIRNPLTHRPKRRRVDPDPTYAPGSSINCKTTIKRSRVNTKIDTDWKRRAMKRLSRSEYRSMYKILYKKCRTGKKDMESVVYSIVRAEAKDIKKHCKMLSNPVIEENIEKFDWDEVVEIVSKKMPCLLSAICAVLNEHLDYVIKSKCDESHGTRAAIGNVIATLLYLSGRKKCGFVAGLNSLLLWRSGCVNVKVFDCLHNLGICLGRASTGKLVGRLTKLPTNHVKGKVNEKSNIFTLENDRLHSENEQSDDHNSVEDNEEDENEQSYDHNSLEENKDDENEQSCDRNSVEENKDDENEQFSDHNSVEENEDEEDKESYDHNSVVSSEDDSDEQSDVFMSDNEEHQSDDEISQDSSEGNNEQDGKVS